MSLITFVFASGSWRNRFLSTRTRYTTRKSNAFERRFSVRTTYQDFERQIEPYSEFGLQVASWYVYGNSQNWGIYLAELPTINIIGCKAHLKERFRQVFKISDSGYRELKDFIKQEFIRQELIEQFETNYRLKDA